jgi:hypothetical protein
MPNRKTHKGRFKPANPQKYRGDVNDVIYRSSWELRVFRYLDQHPDVLEWGSEICVIPYVSPVDNKVHRYFVDVWVKKKDPSGQINILIIEIKPKKEMFPPEKKSKITKRYLEEVRSYAVNQAKWESASNYAKELGWSFAVLTEDQIYGKGKK